MQFLLSIRTVFPQPGRRVWYDDQREAHLRILRADDEVSYDFMGTDPDAADNRWLHDAMQHEIPVIYFLGIAPRQFQAMIPTFIVGWDPSLLKAQIAFGLDEGETLGERDLSAGPPGLSQEGVRYEPGIPSLRERRYALRSVKQRLHQASFRAAVITAYQGRCALSGLPEPLLLDAAHIVRDKHELWGQPIVSNGLPLSKVHHAAFDAHLIGVDPDYRIHVSDRLLDQHDGTLLQALKGLDGGAIHRPRRKQDYPSRERLEMRFAAFKAAT
jgi:putative restriction endonuclease